MNEKKYIEVDLLKSELKDLNESERLYYMGVFDIINSQPIVDAKEVRHGKWERSEKSFSYYQYKCNNCGCDDYTQTDRQGECKLMNYCPNCGAKMDKEQE